MTFVRSRLLGPLLCLVVGAACAGGDDSSGSTSASAPDTTGATPTSTSEAPLTDPTITLVPVVDMPGASSVADPPGDGPVLVSTLAGEVAAVDLATGAADVVLDLTDEVSSGGEQGLLDLAVSPDGGRLVANVTDVEGRTQIRSWALDAGRPTGEGIVHMTIEQPHANHNGGNLEFGPDGNLWIGTGDGGGAGDPDDRAQDPDDLLGKMLRITLDPDGGYTVPDDNPTGGAPEVWAVGLRNPWRYSFDRDTGLLWIADVGQSAAEEVSVVDPVDYTGGGSPANFGWNRLEGSEPYEGTAPERSVLPVYTYGHDDGSCSITGGHVYRGDEVSSLKGWYLFGDYCGGWLRALPAQDPSGTGPVELAAGIGPVVSIDELSDGELVVVTDDSVLRIAP